MARDQHGRGVLGKDFDRLVYVWVCLFVLIGILIAVGAWWIFKLISAKNNRRIRIISESSSEVYESPLIAKI